MIQRRTPLKRSTTPLKRTPIRRISKKRAKQVRQYSKERAEYLAANPICEVWLKENGWVKTAPMTYRMETAEFVNVASAEAMLAIGAPASDQVHHRAKRRGAMLNDKRFFLAVCDENHKRIEANLSWARAKGFSENF